MDRAFCEKGGKAKSLGTSILELAQALERLPVSRRAGNFISMLICPPCCRSGPAS
jgi:hypothetical protein